MSDETVDEVGLEGEGDVDLARETLPASALERLEGMISEARRYLRVQLAGVEALIDMRGYVAEGEARLGRSLTPEEAWDPDLARDELERGHLQSLAERILAMEEKITWT